MEVVLVTSSTDAGLACVDISTGLTLNSFKDCVADQCHSLTLIGGSNAYSGHSNAYSGDYFAVAQAKKPVVHIYEWGKAQVSTVCHQQEILTALANNGHFIFGGSKTGRVSIWEVSTGVLLFTWQAHFKAITCLRLNTMGGNAYKILYSF